MIILNIEPYGKTYDLSYPSARHTLFVDLKVDGFFDLEWAKEFEKTLSKDQLGITEVNKFLEAVLDFIKLKYSASKKGN